MEAIQKVVINPETWLTILVGLIVPWLWRLIQPLLGKIVSHFSEKLRRRVLAVRDRANAHGEFISTHPTALMLEYQSITVRLVIFVTVILVWLLAGISWQVDDGEAKRLITSQPWWGWFKHIPPNLSGFVIGLYGGSLLQRAKRARHARLQYFKSITAPPPQPRRRKGPPN